jgi:hypothetical protein
MKTKKPKQAFQPLIKRVRGRSFLKWTNLKFTVALVCLSSPVSSETDPKFRFSVEHIMSTCENLSEQTNYNAGVCLGSLTASLGISAELCAMSRSGHSFPSHFSADSDWVSFAQIAQVFVNWARANPVVWNEPAGPHIAKAMADAFPCRR